MKTSTLTTGELRAATVNAAPQQLVDFRLPDGRRVHIAETQIELVGQQPRLVLVIDDPNPTSENSDVEARNRA